MNREIEGNEPIGEADLLTTPSGREKLAQQLSIPLDHLVMERFTAIFRRLTQENLRYGRDFFFGKYRGEPKRVIDNAAMAIYPGGEGVELWRILKSIVFKAPNNILVVAHVRGDRQVDTQLLAKSLEINRSDLVPAQHDDLKSIGAEYGTVNPLTMFRGFLGIRHIFDSDLIEGQDHPGDNLVFTSPGENHLGFYLAMDMGRYLEVNDLKTYPINKVEPIMERAVARRKIYVLGGDSGQDTLDYGKIIEAAIVHELQRRGVFYGDRSVPDVDTLSRRSLADSINTELYGERVLMSVSQIIDEIIDSARQAKYRPIVTVNAIATAGVVGDMLSGIKEIEHIGPKHAVENLLDGLPKVAYTVLLGLASVYDRERSAFAGKILEDAPNVTGNVREKIQTLVTDLKKGIAGTSEKKLLFQIIESILRSATRADFEKLEGQTVLIVLGASELESFVSEWDRIPDPEQDAKRPQFLVMRSNNPDIIREGIEKVGVNESENQKIRVVFISTRLVVADQIAKRVFEPSA